MPFLLTLKTGRFHYEVFGDKTASAVLFNHGSGNAARVPASELYFHVLKKPRHHRINRDAGLSEHFSHLKTVYLRLGRHRKDPFGLLQSKHPISSEDMALGLGAAAG